jgi:hypothetical protein
MMELATTGNSNTPSHHTDNAHTPSNLPTERGMATMSCTPIPIMGTMSYSPLHEHNVLLPCSAISTPLFPHHIPLLTSSPITSPITYHSMIFITFLDTYTQHLNIYTIYPTHTSFMQRALCTLCTFCTLCTLCTPCTQQYTPSHNSHCDTQ